MSYSAAICFKTVEENGLYKFFRELKDACKRNFESIAEDNFIFMPSNNKEYLLKADSEYAKEQLDRAWMRNSVFTYRFFYIPEHNLLGVFSIPDEVRNIFDLTCYFQNSCDQDYEFEDWKGVPKFEAIAEKWKNATDEEVFQHFEYPDEHTGKVDYDYYRRTFAYDEIWKMCEHYLYSEDDVVYLSMFGGYEISEQVSFVEMCKKYHQEWLEKIYSSANTGIKEE